MRIICKIDYTRYTAELSGSELDTFTKILGKLTSIQEHTVDNGTDILVMPTTPRKPPVEIILLSDCKMHTQADYERAEADKKRVEIAKAVAKFLDGKYGDDSTGFIDSLYYNSVLSYSEHKAEREPNAYHICDDEATVNVLDDEGRTQAITLKRDGTYERKAV